MSHNYIVTAQKPTAVSACVTGIILIGKKEKKVKKKNGIVEIINCIFDIVYFVQIWGYVWCGEHTNITYFRRNIRNFVQIM